jgi:hypothetical protein
MSLIKERFGFDLIVEIDEGACVECGRKHDPALPHDQQKPVYRYLFYDKHGRWPTWLDAMAHCSDEVKESWAALLADQGILL